MILAYKVKTQNFTLIKTDYDYPQFVFKFILVVLKDYYCNNLFSGLHQVPGEQQGQLGQPDEAGPSLQGYSSPDDHPDLPGLRQVLQRRGLPKLRWLRLR